MPAISTKHAQKALKRLLIVDDDASVRLMLDRVLTGEGYVVQTVADGMDALILVQAEPFDLVLLDLGLPPTDGWDIFERVRRVRPVLPIIIITARFGEAETASLARPDALFEKPLDYPVLLRTLARILAAPRPPDPTPMAHGPNPSPFFHAKRDQN